MEMGLFPAFVGKMEEAKVGSCIVSKLSSLLGEGRSRKGGGKLIVKGFREGKKCVCLSVAQN